MLLPNRSWLKRWTVLPGYLVSIVVHAILMLILMHVYLPIPFRALQEFIFQPGLAENSDGFEILGDPSGILTSELNINDLHFSALSQGGGPVQETPNFSPNNGINEGALPLLTQQRSESGNPSAGSFGGSGGPYGSGFGGRGDGKGALLAMYGGSEGSEKSVVYGLEWLAAHQNPNGSWSYDFTKHPNCKGKCGNPGLNQSQNSATALALLPFLGCGITHKQGKAEYRVVVDKGLKFLLKNSVLRPQQGRDFMDVSDGGMYHQGIVSIVICEAAAMSQDSVLKEAAQQAVDFICYAQIPSDGGWRYQPRDPNGGNTSVFGWQILALKSGQMGGAHVPNEVFFKAQRFLDSVVSIDRGAMYGYKSSRDLYLDTRDQNNERPWEEFRRATSAIGLLSQMHMGWDVDHPSLIRGVEYMAAKGPERNNLYYNYYATQVMHHYGGETWKQWNRELRDPLIARQSLDGHERGSWYFDGPWNDIGGRLYTTSLAIMILEVYYRHLPLYQKQAVELEFPLD
ncbi:MAG: terpene cyclase/mutase family protein [Planctomycetaceae bacterium]|nr:terpene cyclase/mutase family protein [Planctomycetaceae bacterium]